MLRDFLRMRFSRSFFSVMLVISIGMIRSSCLMSLNLQFFSNVISFFQCFSGVSLSCLAQKKSPRLWYVFLLACNILWIAVSSYRFWLCHVRGKFAFCDNLDCRRSGAPEEVLSDFWFFSIQRVTGWYRIIRYYLFDDDIVDSFYVVPKSFGPFFGCI